MKWPKKGKLVGGPNDLDQQAFTFEGGQYLIYPIMYETPSYVGEEVCQDSDCPKKGKHKIKIWKSIFQRKYEIVPNVTISRKKGKIKKIVELFAYYRGES